MKNEKKIPKHPVKEDRAMKHALLTIRRAWAFEVPDFEGWGKVKLHPQPLIIHDLNGQVLFYEFEAMQGRTTVGTIKASASKTIGSPVPTVEFGPRTWDPKKASRKAEDLTVERLPKANITETELVCYSYPKIGVRVNFSEPRLGNQSLIFDVADHSLVKTFGADELEGLTSFSFYGEIVEPHLAEKERLWELADNELEAALSKSPRIFEDVFEESELIDVKNMLTPKRIAREILPISISKILTYSPRCPSRTHQCFALYGQRTNVYCAVATGQMILDFHRYYFSQSDIAEAMGTGPGGTTNPGQVAGYETLTGHCLDATLDLSATLSEAKAEIDANRPLKSGSPGHARACAGYRKDFFSPKYWLRIYDPWPWDPDPCKGGKIIWEDWDAVTHTNFIYVRH